MSKTFYPKVYDRYNHPEHEGTSNHEPSLTKQCFKDECDVNLIVAQYQQTGILPPLSERVAAYGDFSDAETYQESLNNVLAAQSAFMELPAQIRSRFDNEPAKMLAFLENEENRDEAIKLGIVNKPPQDMGNGGSPISKSPTDSTLSGGTNV